MRFRVTIILLIFSFPSALWTAFGQSSIVHKDAKVLYENAVYLMEAGNYGGARDYFEQYISTGDTQYQTAASYFQAKCGLILYHLDGEKLMSDFIADNLNSAYSD